MIIEKLWEILIMIKVLHIVSSINGGGVGAVVYNYYSHMNKDLINFDIIALEEEGNQFLHEPFKKLGAEIYYVSKNFKDRFKQVYKIMSENKYDVVHCHMEDVSAIYLMLAKKVGINVRIGHGHLANIDEKNVTYYIKRCFKPFLKYYATHSYACGLDAGKYLWGKKAVEKGNVEIMHNAVDVELNKYNPEIRKKVRNQLRLSDEMVVGNIGRFSYQKNHEFLINCFFEVQKVHKNAILLLVGEGELKDDVIKLITSLNINDKVRLLGLRKDVNELLQAMDIFVLPSRYEGLPVVGIEAQAAGLPCIISDAVTKEMKVIDGVEFLPLNKGSKYWSDKIIELYEQHSRQNSKDDMIKYGFDIETEAYRVGKLYFEYGSNKRKNQLVN